MAIIYLLLALIALAAIGFYVHKRMGEIRERRIKENEYNTAVTLWTFARDMKVQLDEVIRGGTGVISFNNIRVPHGPGYKLTLELAGFDFRIHGLPERLNRSGRLSFYIDKSLTLRAAERNGENATEHDTEYTDGSKDESENMKSDQ
jgi:hypothetical protein